MRPTLESEQARFYANSKNAPTEETEQDTYTCNEAFCENERAWDEELCPSCQEAFREQDEADKEKRCVE